MNHGKAEAARVNAERKHAQVAAHLASASAALDMEGQRIERITSNVLRTLTKHGPMSKTDLGKKHIDRPDRPALNDIVKALLEDGEIIRVGSKLAVPDE